VRRLIQGIVDFRERLLPEYAARFRALAAGQEPDALFISCADSRVVPNLLISSDPGELFVVRNVGNMIPPAATIAGDSVGDLSEASAIEYAVLVLKVRNIVICGHSECGAMKAALTGAQVAGAANLGKWLRLADSAVSRLQREGPLSSDLSPHDQLSQLNVLVQLEHLMSYPIVRQRMAGAASGESIRL
jgi:carbonic anhydrase